MNVNPSLTTAAGREAAALEVQGQGDAVAAHVGGDWAQHSQVNVFAIPFKDLLDQRISTYTLRLLLTEDNSPALPADIVLAVPIVVTGSTPGAIGAAPIIVSQPATVVAKPGARTSLQIIAISGLPMTYQWYRAALLEGNLHDIVVPGGNDSVLVFDAVTIADAGQYRCVVRNDYGPVASGYTTLIVD